jgi:uncharacterized protein (TIGR00297 family)
MIENIIAGIVLAIVISYFAVLFKLLTIDGGIAAAVVGGIIFVMGGPVWALVLLFFFFSSSVFSILFKHKKKTINLKFAKGSKRDAYQVLANGGLGALMSIFHFAFPQENWPWWAFLAVLSVVTADTWATEIGVLSKSKPNSIRDFSKVEKGTSGGITALGMGASFFGALSIAAFNLGRAIETKNYLPILIIAVIGWLGAIVDSWLGATIQAIYFDDTLKIEVENPPTMNAIPIRGWRWVNNDLVNFISAMTAGLLAVLILQKLM